MFLLRIKKKGGGERGNENNSRGRSLDGQGGVSASLNILPRMLDRPETEEGLLHCCG